MAEKRSIFEEVSADAKPTEAPKGLGPPWLRALLATPFAIVVQVVAFLLIMAMLIPVMGQA